MKEFTALRRAFLLLFCLSFCATPARAHNPDTSYLRCVVTPHALSLRFTFDLATLYRIIGFGINAEGRVTRQQMEAASNEIYDYLEESVSLEINGRRVKMGRRQPMGWPVDAGEAIPEKEYRDKLLHFSFLCRSEPLVEDATFTYDVFNQLGGEHRVIADIEQEGKHLEVIFKEDEPDFMYDTYWRAELKPSLRFADVIAKTWSHWQFPVLCLLLMILPLRWMTLGMGGGALAGLAIVMYHSVTTGPAPSAAAAAGIALAIVLMGLLVLPVSAVLRQARRRRLNNG